MLLVRSIATHNITAKMCYLTMYPRKIKYFPYLKKNPEIIDHDYP